VRVFDFEDNKFNLETEFYFDNYDFVWFDDPIEYFDLSSIDCRVSSFEQLSYYAEVFLYLNPDIPFGIFNGIFTHIGSRESGKSIRTYSRARVQQMTEKKFATRQMPYCRRKRRVLFNPSIIISKDEKAYITGILTKREVSFTKQDVLSTVYSLHNRKLKATASSIASEMNCSEKTVLRIIDKDMKEQIKKINEATRKENIIESVSSWIHVLSDNGNKLKMRELKKLSKIRDYDLIKEAIHRYEKGY